MDENKRSLVEQCTAASPLGVKHHEVQGRPVVYKAGSDQGVASDTQVPAMGVQNPVEPTTARAHSMYGLGKRNSSTK